jgi:transcriptional regulator with XRE-family HTH domain
VPKNHAALTPKERFAANLRQARTDAGISQEELGYRCELHRTEISLLERAGREPRLGTIVKLAGALETTPGELCTGIAWQPSRRRFEVKRTPPTRD